MRCKSSPTSGIGFGVVILSLGLAGCPAGSDVTQVAAGPTGTEPIAKTTQALQSTSSVGQTVADPTTAAPGSQAAQALQSALPSGRLSVIGRGVSRFYGPSLAKGATPAASVQAFQQAYLSSLGIAASDLVPRELKQGEAVATSAPQGSGLMYDRATGQPKFWLYRTGQTKNGVKVYHAQLLTLVRNVADYPVVWSSSSLRDLSRFGVSAGMPVRAPDRDKSLRSIRRGPNDFVGRPLLPPQSITSLSPPELVVFAGTEDREVEPRMAIEYTATTAPDGKWHFVADASTGDVLLVESLELAAGITGKVTGNVTQGSAAMDCAPALPTPFPYAEVDGPQPATTSAGVDGLYTLDGDFSGTVTVSSPMVGTHFFVKNFAGALDDLTDTVVSPATIADFLHNAADTDQEVLAQSNGYVQVEQVRGFLLKYLPDYPTISTQTGFEVDVNLSRSDRSWCPDAHYVGPAIEICKGEGGFAPNMAFGDIIHHEYGHHIVQMGGSGQDQYGEGMSDTVAMLYSGHSGVGFGYSLNQCTTPARDGANTCQYDPNFCSSCGDYKNTHGCGMLLSGTIWDIRKNLQATEPYRFEDIINHLTLSSIQKHTGNTITPQIAIDMITLDDDDGDYTNGSPHSTEICTGFAAHGMSCPPFFTGFGVSPPTAFSVQGPFGGPFAPASVIYTVENFGPTPSIQYQVTASPAVPWLTITNGSGSAAMGQTAQVKVAIDQGAGLGKGEYDAVLQFTNLTNGVGNQTRAVHLAIGLEPILSETFERGLGSFSFGSEPTNLWHASNGCASGLPGHSAVTSLYFGIDSSCNYDNGQIVAGTATSGSVTVTNTSLAKLRFNYFLVTEHNEYYDQASVQLSVNGGPFTVVASNNQNQGGVVLTDGGSGWEPAEVDLTPYLAGFSSATVQVRFAFDSVENLFNALTGFLVDDVQIMALNNQAPTVNAGAPIQTITFPAGATLWGTASDDGLPNPPAKLTTTWSKVSGPGTVTFADPTAAQTTATFSTSGTYVLQLTGTDSALSTSATCTVTVAPAVAPFINTQPQTRNITEGQPVTFTVVATGTAPLHYQWKKNGTVLGPDAASLTISAAKQSDAGNYTVTVSNTAGSVTSATATLIVMSVPPSITSQPKSQTVTAGQSVTFTVTATGTAPLHYQWRRNGATVGGDSASYTISSVQMSDATTYTVMVTNAVGSVTSNNATLTVKAVAPVITTQPLSQTKKAGQSVTFTVTATGTAPLTYQWKKGSNGVGGNSTSFTISAVKKADAGTYAVTVSNSAGSTTSNSATLTVN